MSIGLLVLPINLKLTLWEREGVEPSIGQSNRALGMALRLFTPTSFGSSRHCLSSLISAHITRLPLPIKGRLYHLSTLPFMVPRGRFERPTLCLEGRCFYPTELPRHISMNFVWLDGFEPPAFCTSSRCTQPLYDNHIKATSCEFLCAQTVS